MSVPESLIRRGSFYRGVTGDIREVTEKGFSSLAWRSTTNPAWWGVNYPVAVFAAWATEETIGPQL